MNRTERMCQPSAQAVMGQAVGAISKLKAQIAKLEQDQAEAQNNVADLRKEVERLRGIIERAVLTADIDGTRYVSHGEYDDDGVYQPPDELPNISIIEMNRDRACKENETLRAEVERLRDTIETQAKRIAELESKLEHGQWCERVNTGLHENARRVLGKRDSLTGWFVVEECEDGSLLLENSSGDRRHVWSCDIAERE